MTSIHPSPLAVAPDIDLPQRRDGRRVVVRVTLPRTAEFLRKQFLQKQKETFYAKVESCDGSVREIVAVTRPLLARFGSSESTFFLAELDGDDIELGDITTESRW